MALWDWLNRQFSSDPALSTDITDYNRAADPGPGDVGIKQVAPQGPGMLGSSIGSDSSSLGGIGNNSWSWRDLAEGLSRAGTAAGADNRYLPPGLAIGAFGSGLVQGTDAAQENRLKLENQFRLQSAQAQNLLAAGDLSKAQAGAIPSEIDQRKAATEYQRLVSQGYPAELAAKIAEQNSRTTLNIGQASAIPSSIAETMARTAYTNELAASQSPQRALAAANAALAQAETMLKQGENQRNQDWYRQSMGLPPINRAGSPQGDFGTSLIARESSGNPNAQTPVQAGGTGGYSGLYQFGAPRLQDLGMYTPGEGDFKGKEWTGSWNGKFNIPGAPDIKTVQDFMANPNAQHTAFGAHVTDIDNKIRADGLTAFVGGQLADGTPVTVDGMRAAAHLGGYTRMKNYVMSGGRTDNTSDRLGTKVGDYFRQFAGGGAAPAAPATSQATPAQRAIMGGGGAAGGGFGGLTQPDLGATTAAPPAPALPTPGGGFAARAGAPLSPAQSVLAGGGDVLGGLSQPVPGSPGAPAVFAGPGAPPAPLNPQQAVLSSGGFSGPGLGGGPAGDPLGGITPPASAVPQPAVARPAQSTPQAGVGLGLDQTINSMPPAIRASLGTMTAAEGTKYVANWVKDQIGREVTIPAAEAEKLGIPGTSGFNPGTVLQITPKLGGGMPDIKIAQAGLPPMQPFEQEEKLSNSFKNDPEIKDFPKSKTHLDTMNTLYNKFLTNPSGATGAAMVIELGKMIDPAQVVRQTEANKIESNSVSPRVTELYNRYNYSGSSIGPEQARDLLDNAYQLHAGRIDTVADAADAMRLRARSWGVSVDNVVNPKLFPPDLKAKALADMEAARPKPVDMAAATTAVGAPAVKPAEPVKVKYGADWANTFDKPADFSKALLQVPLAELYSIPKTEIDKMTQPQKEVLARMLQTRRFELGQGGM